MSIARVGASVGLLSLLAACSSSDLKLDHPSEAPTGKIPYASSTMAEVTIGSGDTVWYDVSGMDPTGGRTEQVIVDTNGTLLFVGLRANGATLLSWDNGWSGTLADIGPFYRANAEYENETVVTQAPFMPGQAGRFPAGSWQIGLKNPTGGEVTGTVTRLSKTDADLSRGVIDLNFWVFGGSGGTPGIPGLPLRETEGLIPPIPGLPLGDTTGIIQDQGDADAIRDLLKILLADTGITIGTFTTHFVEDTDAVGISSEQDMLDFYRKAAQATAGRKDVGINCFLVPRLPGDILGMDGTIPGPGFLHGTRASGLIAQMGSYGAELDGLSADETDRLILAVTLAHEIGHYLGLYHLNEYDGSAHDPLSDTPECRKADDSDGDDVLIPEECHGKGADYLMFWALNE
ncbi:MAG: hypothetical protein HQK87_11830, partial [Nitrospinae bacterium]|nr:hypothetical protein [Nitrospinota bacterium]